LTGFFGEASVPRERMLAVALTSADKVIEATQAAVWGDAYITEKVETKADWQFPVRRKTGCEDIRRSSRISWMPSVTADRHVPGRPRRAT
jgi:hypothetical protein